MGHLFKNQLQIYAQKRNFILPKYATEREGPPHAPRFKGNVTLDGKSYESPGFFGTVKEAENAAAQVALLSLCPNGVCEDDSSFSKNLLQELIMKEYGCLPQYTTNRYGMSHMPIFVSTVDIKGESFQGQEAKTKKQAEMNAAKVAYMILMDRKKRPDPVLQPQASHVKEAPEFSSANLLPVPAPSVGSSHRPSLLSSVISKGQAECGEGGDQRPTHSEPVTKNSSMELNQNRIISDMRGMSMHQESPIRILTPAQSHSNSGITASGTQSRRIPSAYKKVEVFPNKPGTTFTPGMVVKHRDEKWVAVMSDSARANPSTN